MRKNLPFDFFIAHSSADASEARELTERLRDQGCEVVLDADLPHPGDTWPDRLVKAQKNSWITLVLVSSSAAKAHYLKAEIARAIKQERAQLHRVVPVWLDAASEQDPPYGLEATHALSLIATSVEDVVLGAIDELARLRREEEVAPSPGGFWPVVPSNRAPVRAQLEELDQELRHSARDAALLAARADALLALERHEDALVTLTEIVDADAADAATFARQARNLQLLNRADEAVANSNRALQLDQDEVMALAVRAEISLQRGRTKDAYNDADHAVRVDRDYEPALRIRGLSAYVQGLYDSGRRDLKRAVRLRPSVANYVLLARGLANERRLEHAELEVDRALRLIPNDVEALTLRGDIRTLRRHYGGALADYAAALALRPDHPVLLAARGSTLIEMGRLDAALVDLNRALEVEPESPHALGGRGLVLHRREQFEDALSDFDRALALEPRNSSVLHNRADALRRLGRFDEALTGFDAALSLNPDDVATLTARGMLRAGLNDIIGATQDLDAALRLDPGNVTVSNVLDALRNEQSRLATMKPAAKLAVGAVKWVMSRKSNG